MKNVFLIVFFALPAMAMAQIREDQWLIGGNVFYSYSKSKQLKFVSFQLSPAAGYFFLDKLAGGLRLNVSSDTYRWATDGFRISSTSIAPFLRYYFLPVQEKLNLFADASFGYSWGKYKDLDFGGSHRYRHYNFALMAGPAIFLNEHTALEVTVGYNYLSRGPIDSTVTNKFQFGIGLQVHIGK